MLGSETKSGRAWLAGLLMFPTQLHNLRLQQIHRSSSTLSQERVNRSVERESHLVSGGYEMQLCVFGSRLKI